MIDLYLLCYNEEKILQFVIDHYRKYLPNARIIIYDNMSTDNSEKIIRDNACEIRKFDTNNTFNDEKHMNIKNNCWKEPSKNNWVLIADLDELPCVTEDQLREEELNGVSILSFDDYNLVGGETGFDLLSLKKGHKTFRQDKYHIFNRNLIKEINYDAGAHHINPVGKIKFSNKKYLKLHYKWISLEYVINRHHMYSLRLSDINKKNGWGFQYNWERQKIIDTYNSLLPQLIDIL